MSSGCLVEWDGVNCWPAVSVGERVSVSCPPPLLKSQEPISRTCTSEGWSNVSVPYYIACFQDNSTEEEEIGQISEYFAKVKLIYTVGYGMSLSSLCIAVFTFCIFRKLLCRRIYIHLNLFSTFILRALAVFVKDAVLFADETVNHCTVSTLHISQVNFLMFVNISRIIIVKTKTPDSNGGDKRFYRRLAKSTLLLIPLFGVHYIVFALFPEHVGLEARLFFELVLGSFQGFIVALLYCFLNSEVGALFII
ncbi:growth hormone releasing hormone receptor 2 [Danio aesculapii]|uniref:growth hormone releasing hormone receptor 2 n=1 Tax=Danio aesculapii TaxID=1142201 RepID=UPI0024C09CB5|nr:growth hormone releasing hormone receptor 2 [Danio aesculapii]